MEEVSTRAKLVDSGVEPTLMITIPRNEVEEALEAEDGEAELLLDVVRSSNGHLEQRRVAVEWERADLEKLIRESSGERVTLIIDPDSLQVAFDTDVEAHGMREAAVALSIVVATAGAAVGGAKAAVDQFGGSAVRGSSDAYASIENVRAGAPSQGASADIENVRAGQPAPEAAPDAYAGIENVRAGAPSQGASADIENVRAGQPAPEAAPDAYAGIENVRAGASSQGASADIENVRAGQPAPEAAPDAYAGIENVRTGAPASPDPYAGIESARAVQTAPEAGGGGVGISAPSPGEAAGLAGAAAALTIAGAAFALRRRRQPGIA
jgi:hypothetical protein